MDVTDHDQKIEAAQKLHEEAQQIRGRIVNSVAVIERDIAIILTDYFCAQDDAKKELFYSKVAEKLSLQKKKAILLDIIKRDYPKYWSDENHILKHIQSIQEFRNKLAHSVVDVSDEALSRPIKEGVGFIQWNKGKPISAEEFQEMNVKINMVLSALTDIKRLLPFIEGPLD